MKANDCMGDSGFLHPHPRVTIVAKKSATIAPLLPLPRKSVRGAKTRKVTGRVARSSPSSGRGTKATAGADCLFTSPCPGIGTAAGGRRLSAQAECAAGEGCLAPTLMGRFARSSLACRVIAACLLAILLLGLLPGRANAQQSEGQSPALAPIQISPERRQLIGLKFATVTESELTDRVMTTGTVEPDEQLQSYIQTRFSGWLRTVFVNQTYQYVRKGEPLFTIYSPDLASAEQEYLVALKEKHSVTTAAGPGVKQNADSLADAALARLKLFGVAPREIARLEREGVARDTVEIDSPVAGFVTDRAALPNMYVQPDTRLYTIADLSRVWVYAAVFQDELGEIKVGDAASVGVDAYPGKSFDGRVDYIWPQIDPTTRTARVRLAFGNQGLLLKPGMFVNVTLTPRLGRGLVIPDSGVLRTGTHNIAFVDRGDGYLEPVDVELGPHLGSNFVVRKGLRAGQRIVASANFLVDSESQLQAALGAFIPPPPGARAAAVAPTAQIEVTTDPSPPHKGRNTVRVKLSDSFGRAIEGAEVSVVFFMPAMPAMGMSAMKAQAKATEQSAGNYVATIELDSGGTWQATVVANKAGKQIASRQMSVSATGPM
jgi:RND family efflux transporter MFP subunit